MDRDRTQRRRVSTLTRWGAAALALVSVVALQSSASADLEDTLPEDTRLPGQGLPGYAQNPGTGGFWVAPQAMSLNYAAAAQQWIRPPTLQIVANNLRTQNLQDPGCSGRLGEGVRSTRAYRRPVVFVNLDSTPGASDRFGRTQGFTVRTVAFGSVPVEADIALEQPRNDQAAVVPSILTQTAIGYCAGEGPFPTRPPGAGPTNSALVDTSLTGEVTVRITALRVDGVDVGTLSTCAAPEGALSLASPDYDNWDPSVPADERPPASNADLAGIYRTAYFNFANGGLLTGTLDVPRFRGCSTPDGDDVSPLLTAAVSGPCNPVTIRSEGLPPGGGVDDNSDFDDPDTSPCPWTSNACENRFPTPLDIPDGTPGG